LNRNSKKKKKSALQSRERKGDGGTLCRGGTARKEKRKETWQKQTGEWVSSQAKKRVHSGVSKLVEKKIPGRKVAERE